MALNSLFVLKLPLNPNQPTLLFTKTFIYVKMQHKFCVTEKLVAANTTSISSASFAHSDAGMKLLLLLRHRYHIYFQVKYSITIDIQKNECLNTARGVKLLI